MTFNEDNNDPDNDLSSARGSEAPAVNRARPSATQNMSPASSAPASRKLRRLKRVVVGLKTAKRQMSSIAFPYVDLDTVIALARAMNDVGGLALTRDQLAGALRQSSTSGSFILKTSAARQFGVIELGQNNKFQLTAIGYAIVGKDEAQERAARVSAFLSVPLYRKAYDEFRGRALPPRPLGLEHAFVQFGVSPKQKDTARQIFEKSARQAGFLEVDPDRLVEPVAVALLQGERSSVEVPIAHASASLPNATASRLDPLIQGLVDRLPSPGTTWEPEKRARWLQTLAANFDMVYETESGGVVLVQVKEQGTQD